MTRAEAYSLGWEEGREWAEADLREGLGLSQATAQALREVAQGHLACRRPYNDAFDALTAKALGRARGCRDIARGSS